MSLSCLRHSSPLRAFPWRPPPKTALPPVLRPDEVLQNRVNLAFHPLAEHEAMVAGKLRDLGDHPNREIVIRPNDRQFLVVCHLLLYRGGISQKSNARRFAAEVKEKKLKQQRARLP